MIKQLVDFILRADNRHNYEFNTAYPSRVQDVAWHVFGQALSGKDACEVINLCEEGLA